VLLVLSYNHGMPVLCNASRPVGSFFMNSRFAMLGLLLAAELKHEAPRAMPQPNCGQLVDKLQEKGRNNRCFAVAADNCL
jgi:hypothetical protein